MKRISLLATLVVVALAAIGAFASSSMAAPGSSLRASLRAVTRSDESFTTTYDAPEYYGEVTCTGKHVVNKKSPGGKDVETCTAVSGVLVHMKAGKGQKEFENTSGGFVTGWDSDFNGVETHEFTFSVAKSLKKFKITAIY